MEIKLSEHFTYRKLLKFTIPSIVMMMFTSIYGVIDDGVFVSNFVGKDAFVALNIMAPVLMIFTSIAFMIGAGGNAIISKTLGEGKEQKASEYFSLIIGFTFLIGIIFSVIGLLVLKPFCNIMGAKDGVLDNCLLYGKIVIPLSIVFLLQTVFQNLLLTAGKPKLAMGITIASGISNITLDILLIIVFKMGLIGAVLATVSGALISSLVPLLYFIFSKKQKIKFVKPKIYWKVIGNVCYNGLSELISNLSMGLVAILFNYQLMKIAGDNGIASYGAIMYVATVFASAFMGYSMGVAPIVGYNYGANTTNELNNIFKKSIVIIIGIGILLTLISELCAIPFSKIFVSYDKELLDMTVHGLRIYSIAFLFMGLNVFGSSFFTALNNGFISGVLSFFRTFLLQVITVMILPKLFQLDGIWLSIIVAEILMLFITIFTFKKMNVKYNYINN